MYTINKIVILQNQNKYELYIKRNEKLYYIMRSADKDELITEGEIIIKEIEEKDFDKVYSKYEKRKKKQQKTNELVKIEQNIFYNKKTSNYKVRMKYKGTQYELGTYQRLEDAIEMKALAKKNCKQKTFESFYNNHKNFFSSKRKKYSTNELNKILNK